MKIFLAGIIQGSIREARIHDQDWRVPIRAALARYVPGAEVYCHYEAHPNSIAYELPRIISTLEDGNRRAAAADVVICYVPEASMGTAIEMYLAAKAGALVLVVSPMMANWVIRAYSDRVFPDVEAFERFLAAGELEEVPRRKRHPG